ncbi:vacuolar basic amino acid transporter 2 [Gaeumannomyces tritici R3-111a-1]|uniref:Vacuolar basic amino acid transporter 2 n=1 Tax=Gaeumannomyces tritici (strain R3-111a-1) TaxID=644352 RepID=J3PH08_GAET3|nr:vacuolar basic amino acid transporter 2 [Gaeumannomyces tritici R3-111a-1]EJT69905.1 vacuolar basic amino acid transporter 2 [Gaeumannomyces tritici R3-111a-1]
MALLLGYLVVENPAADVHTNRDDDNGDVDLAPKSAWRRVDILGSLVLVFAVSVQLLGLSLGGNELPWSSPWVVAALVVSATPIIRLHLLRGSLPILTQTANMCLGLSAYAYLFMLPLFFQVVLEDSATTAGVRLAIPSLATPLGGLVTGLAMARWGKLLWLMRLGALVMVLGNALVTSLKFSDSSWKYIAYIFPANLGQGIVFPSSCLRLSLRLSIQLIDEIRHPVAALKSLLVEVRLAARRVYYDGIRYAFATSTGMAAVALMLALLASPRGLRRNIK